MAAFYILVFASTGTKCTITTGLVTPPPPGQPLVTTTPSTICTSTSLAETQSTWWPLPGLALAVWTLAPLLAVAGVWSRRLELVTLALVLEATALISFGAGPVYVPMVLPALAVTWVLARRALRPARPSA